jgi:hypothetical protein
MARRRKSGPVEDLSEPVVGLPWRAGAALALAGRLRLHLIAGQAPAVAGQAGPHPVGFMRQARAGAGQAEAHTDADEATPPRAGPGQASACTMCGKSALPRTAKRGADAGDGFQGGTGCSACRGTRPAG